MEEASEQRQTSEWLRGLRQQFERIASRRVDQDDVEDVVQEALRVVAQKGLDSKLEAATDFPHLAWCFQVLRNTIGNHYRRETTRRQRFVAGSEQLSEGETPMRSTIETMDSVETLRVIEGALAEMDRDQPQCGRYLTRLVEGLRPQEVAAEEQLESAVFYRRLYRCRQKLRDLLAAKGVVT